MGTTSANRTPYTASNGLIVTQYGRVQNQNMTNTYGTTQNVVGTTGTVYDPVRTNYNQHTGTSAFNRSITGPNKKYAQPTNQHLALGQSATYTRQNLATVFGRSLGQEYPTGQGQIYSVP